MSENVNAHGDAAARAKIKNREVASSHGDAASRGLVLEATERVLRKLDAYERIKSIAYREGSILHIGNRTWDLSKKRHVYLVGSGKACNHMAMAIDEILGDYLTRGIAIVKMSEPTDVFRHTEVYVGGHPIPNEVGYEASLKCLELADNAGPDDLFIGVISGGSSALMSCPVEGITLQDEMDATDVLLKSGAGIYEINAVRRHISQMNGGRLAQRIQASGAEFIGFGISDAVGNPPTGDIAEPYANYKSTPIGPDATTLDDARRVIDDYDLADKLPTSVVEYLRSAGPDKETPKAFPDNTYFLLNTVPDMCRYAQEVAEEMGVPSMVLTSFLEGEARDLGTAMASIAREIQAYGNPMPAPCFVISAGEATTRIPDSSVITGHGGCGQEMTVGFALAAAKAPGACLLSIDSEGTDGTTDIAGGITDSATAAAADAAGVDLHAALRGHACYEALVELGDTVKTGNTGTNLCDFNLMYVPALEK